MTHDDKQRHFDLLCAALTAAGVLEPGVPIGGPHSPTLYHEPVGAHEDGRERRPLYQVRWDPAPAPGRPHVEGVWRKGVSPDDPARQKFKELLGAFLSEALA